MNDFQKAFPSPFNEDHFISTENVEQSKKDIKVSVPF